MHNTYSFEELVEAFFSADDKVCTLNEGEALMEQGAHNRRLYLLLSGRMSAYGKDSRGQQVRLFRMSRHMFAGVYSFFSRTYTSKTTIIAESDCRLAYIDADFFEQHENPDGLYGMFLPVILDDLNARINTAHLLAVEKEHAMDHLLHTEKMATLGQLAAGLSHELNNAVGVLKSKAAQLSDHLDELLTDVGDPDLLPVLKKAREAGNQLSTREVREVRGEISATFGVDASSAKALARTGFSVDELDILATKLSGVQLYWEIGTALHDMEVAARHASAVVHSVKKLGGKEQARNEVVDLKVTIEEAITLLQSTLRRVEVQVELDDNIRVTGDAAELVQVWINVIKNAVESLIHARTENPIIVIQARKLAGRVVISIRDNGPGIPRHLMKKIFQPDVTTKKGGLSFGLGLGLPISQRIVERHGGELLVNSEPGETVFLVTFPL